MSYVKSYLVTYSTEPKPSAVCVSCAEEMISSSTGISRDWISNLSTYEFGKYVFEPQTRRAFVPCGYCDKLA